MRAESGPLSSSRPPTRLGEHAGLPDAWRVRVQRLIAIGIVTGAVVAVAAATQPSGPPSGDLSSTESIITAPSPEMREGIQPSLIDSSVEQTPIQLPGPPQPAEPERPDAFIRFTVQPGDTVFDISQVYGISVEEILRFNPSLGDGTRVFVGQEVSVPQFDK